MHNSIWQLKSLFFLFCAAGFLSLLAGCAGPQLTIPQIIEMSKEGVPDQKICEKIDQSSTIYRLKGSQLAELSNAGLSDSVIDCIQQTYVEAVRQDQTMEDWDNWTMNDDGYWYW